MSLAMDRYNYYMAEEGYDGLNRGHLTCSGYEYEDGYWYATFVNKVVVARKDHPKFNIKKGQKHRYVSFKYICDETGASSWEVERKALGKTVAPAPVLGTPQWGFNSTESSWTGSWTRKDK